MLQTTAVEVGVRQPETVADTPVSFVQRAKAIPGVLDVFFDIEDVERPDGQGIDFHEVLPYLPDSHEEVRMVVTDRHVIVGWLSHSDCMTNPCEPGMSNGFVLRSDDEDFPALIGLDRYGSKVLEGDACKERFVKHIMRCVTNDLVVLTCLMNRLRANGMQVSKATLADLILKAIEIEGWGNYGLDYVCQRLWGVKWYQMEDSEQRILQAFGNMFCEQEVDAAWNEAYAAGEIVDPTIIPLSVYEHSDISFSTMNFPEDVEDIDALWVPCEDAGRMIRAQALQELGVGELKYYNPIDDPNPSPNARFGVHFSIDGGKSWVGKGCGWEWSKAMNEMEKAFMASGRKIDSKKLRDLLHATALRWCEGVLDEYNDWCNGYTYNLVCYTIDRQEEHPATEEEMFSVFGSDADSCLERTVLSVAKAYGERSN